MRIGVALLIGMLLPYSVVFGEFVNDSEVIQINEPGPEVAPPETIIEVGSDTLPSTPEDTTTSQENSLPSVDGTDSGAVIVFEDETEGDSITPASSTAITEVDVAVSVGSTGGTAPSETVVDTTTEGFISTEARTTENILTTLIGGQGVVVYSSGVGGGTLGTGIDDVYIAADRVRTSFEVQRIIRIELPPLGQLLQENAIESKSFNHNDFALFVASRILADAHIDDVHFSEQELSVQYRAPGRLFAFLPTRYTLRTSVAFSEDGVVSPTVRFPWYSFFLQTGVSRGGLERVLKNEIEQRVVEEIEVVDFDLAALTFDILTEIFRTRLGV